MANTSCGNCIRLVEALEGLLREIRTLTPEEFSGSWPDHKPVEGFHRLGSVRRAYAVLALVLSQRLAAQPRACGPFVEKP